jgi:hypothetical protein
MAQFMGDHSLQLRWRETLGDAFGQKQDGVPNPDHARFQAAWCG